MNTPSDVRIRQPHFADNRWYSADPAQLKADIQKYLDASTVAQPTEQIIGLVAPHAGYFFSGHVAGASFATLSNATFNTVILIGPDHWRAAPGKISTPEVDVWRTPLGDIPVAWDVLRALDAEIDLVFLPTDQEHSLEIELPFLQATLKQFKLVPLMMGSQKAQLCRQLAGALVDVLDATASNPALFVASSDLSHYFDDDTARNLDQETIQFMLNLDTAGLLQHIVAGNRRNEPLACGAGPIATTIHAAKSMGATQTNLLKYATSADAHPDKSRVVGYAAVAISKHAT